MKTWLEGLRRDLWVYLVVAALLTAVVVALSGDVAAERLPAVYCMNALITVAIGATVTGLLAVVGSPERAWVARVLRFVAVVAGMVVGLELALLVGGFVLPDAAGAFPRRSVLQVAVPVTIAMVLVGTLRDRLVTLRAERALERATGERALLRAEIAVLQARTNPHFLFNSLNTVAALIGEDPVRAERAVEKLAGLFRYALAGTEREKVPLADELNAVEQYLDLERLRFGDRLEAVIDVPERARGLLVPPMLLQPIVENAVSHGIAGKPGRGRLALTASIEGTRLRIVVEDDGPGPGGSAHRGTGTSQADLRARLQLLYGDSHDVEAGPGARGGYRIAIAIPAEVVP